MREKQANAYLVASLALVSQQPLFSPKPSFLISDRPTMFPRQEINTVIWWYLFVYIYIYYICIRYNVEGSFVEESLIERFQIWEISEREAIKWEGEFLEEPKIWWAACKIWELTEREGYLVTIVSFCAGYYKVFNRICFRNCYYKAINRKLSRIFLTVSTVIVMVQWSYIWYYRDTHTEKPILNLVN